MILSWTHGFLGLPEDWHEFLAQSAWKNTNVTHDLRNLWLDLQTLESTGLAPEANWLELLADRVAAGIAGRKKPTVLIGYSMGGRVSLLVARDRRVQPYLKGLILISTHPGLIDAKEQAARCEADERWAARFKNDLWDETLRAWEDQAVLQRTGGLDLPARREENFNREILSLSMRGLSLGRQPSALVHEDLWAERWPFPALLINGEKDRKFAELGEKWSASVAARGGDLPHVIVPNAGHRVPWDQSGRTSEIILDFLSKISAS